ncbi:hypothetical protein MYAM1_003520 [Malassezia yamatoensis]|uniref:LisH domain-containing protein n=1 Tax=Malassezia yamatoensis TaxID=253288 RepID=A0AAJ6CHX1_9BASI|nr:hypothetical protein MYAM1_003520 [Malassezia yamatoensis]
MQRENWTSLCNEIVAKYLSSQGYTESLHALEKAAGNSSLVADGYDGVPRNLRTLIEQSLSIVSAEALSRLQFEEKSTDALDESAAQIKQDEKQTYAVEKSLEDLHSSNILSIHTVSIPIHINGSWELTTAIATTGADKLITISDPDSGEVHHILDNTAVPLKDGAVGHDSAVLDLSQNPKHQRFIASAGMDGRIVIWDMQYARPYQTLKEHSRFVVRVTHSACGCFMASAGYDKKIVVYSVQGDSRSTIQYAKIHEICLDANPEAILFVPGPLKPPIEGRQVDGNKRTWLVFSQRGQVELTYAAMPCSDMDQENSLNFTLLRYNTNPDPDDHYAGYSLLDLSLHPSGQYLCAQTGDHVAAQRGSPGDQSVSLGSLNSGDSLSRLLILPLFSQMRRTTLWTEAPSSTFSNPRHAWCENGCQVWVTGEDGLLRQISIQGKVTASIPCHGQLPAVDSHSKNARHAATAAAWMRGGNTVIKGVIVLPDGRVASCGFDRTVKIVGKCHS